MAIKGIRIIDLLVVMEKFRALTSFEKNGSCNLGDGQLYCTGNYQNQAGRGVEGTCNVHYGNSSATSGIILARNKFP